MSWSWCFWKRETTASIEGLSKINVRQEPKEPEEWEARLIEAGVSIEWARQIADLLSPRHADLGRGSAVALIEGAAVAVRVQAAAHAGVERNMKDVREVERLLGAFSGELEKLDEVLEVLSAYAQKMRSKPGNSSRRTLH
jgi:hypothetical protein